MPIHAKKVKSDNPRFQGRETIIMTASEATKIPIPDDVVLCNGCNRNVEEGYLVYLGKRELKADQPYDIFCSNCLHKYFPKAMVEEGGNTNEV